MENVYFDMKPDVSSGGTTWLEYNAACFQEMKKKESERCWHQLGIYKWFKGEGIMADCDFGRGRMSKDYARMKHSFSRLGNHHTNNHFGQHLQDMEKKNFGVRALFQKSVLPGHENGDIKGNWRVRTINEKYTSGFTRRAVNKVLVEVFEDRDVEFNYDELVNQLKMILMQCRIGGMSVEMVRQAFEQARDGKQNDMTCLNIGDSSSQNR